MSTAKKRLGKRPSERRHPIFAATTAMAGAIRDTAGDMEGMTTLSLCARVGEVTGIPAGYRVELTSCFRCGANLWISSETKEAAESKGMTVKAMCHRGCGD